MSKFLLIGSVAAMLYGDCVWGMGDDIDPWRGTSSSESDQFNAEPTRENGKASYQDAQIQTEQSWSEHVRANPQQLQENRFIKIEFEGVKGYGGALTGAVLNNTYLQYHYAPSNDSKIGHATPTTVVTVTRDDLKCWNDISEIRYANDVSYDKLENPKVVLYRNKDSSCYIILRIGDNKYGVFYGLNERNVEIGRNSFAVYDVSEDVGSFTDGVKRLIYVDESGLYFVPRAENPVEDVINSYQNEGKFDFKGPVIKVSAIDGSITWNGEPVTKENFFNNWVREVREVQGRNSKVTMTVLSTKLPGEKEVLRNFYPPKENYYDEIYRISDKTSSGTSSGWMNVYASGKFWLNSFINKRFQLIKTKSRNGAEELVRDGTFSSILLACPYDTNNNNYFEKVRNVIAAQFVSKGKKISYDYSRYSIPALVRNHEYSFKDPEFVRGLKPGFAQLEKDYEHNKESDMWILFEIVRNL